jgi:DNA-binding response OmpR family regulator
MEVKMGKLSEAKSDSGRKKVLFIDDDPDYVMLMKLVLEKKYEVITAFSAEEGWEKMGKQRPDLILLDAMMEPKSGFTLAKELKAHQTYKDIPIVMLTGVVPQIPRTKYSPDDILRFTGEDILEKSAGTEEILSTIKKYLYNSKSA